MLLVYEDHRKGPLAEEPVAAGEAEPELRQSSGTDRLAPRVLAKVPGAQEQTALNEDHAVPDQDEKASAQGEAQAGDRARQEGEGGEEERGEGRGGFQRRQGDRKGAAQQASERDVPGHLQLPAEDLQQGFGRGRNADGA